MIFTNVIYRKLNCSWQNFWGLKGMWFFRSSDLVLFPHKLKCDNSLETKWIIQNHTAKPACPWNIRFVMNIQKKTLTLELGHIMSAIVKWLKIVNIWNLKILCWVLRNICNTVRLKTRKSCFYLMIDSVLRMLSNINPAKIHDINSMTRTSNSKGVRTYKFLKGFILNLYLKNVSNRWEKVRIYSQKFWLIPMKMLHLLNRK